MTQTGLSVTDPPGSVRAWSAVRRDVASHPIAWAYLVLALAVGMTLVILVPPFQANDEPEHFFRSWAVGEGELVVGPRGVLSLPENVAWLFGTLKAIEVTQGAVDYDPPLTFEHLGEEISPNRVDQTTLTGTYSPIGYVPQAAGVLLSRLLGLSPLVALYLARFFVLWTSIALAFVALRLTPFGAPVLALIALLPMSLTLGASLNPSALLNAATLLWLALVLAAMGTKGSSTARVACLCAVATLLLTLKPGYAALSLLILLVPRDRFPSPAHYWTTVVACIAGSFGLAGALILTAPEIPLAVLHERGVPVGVDAGAQLRFVVAHPRAFAEVLLRTVGSESLAWMKAFVGAPGRGSVILSDLVTLVALLGGLLLMMRGAVDAPALALWRRAGFIVVACGTAVAVVLALYVVSTPLTAPAVAGVQGRYFLPVIPCLLVGLYGLRLQRRGALVMVLAGAALLMAVMTLLALVGHYYT